MHIYTYMKKNKVYHRSQFKIVRLEDFNSGPKEHLEGIFEWLGLEHPSVDQWQGDRVRVWGV
jgi:hypothetical protein